MDVVVIAVIIGKVSKCTISTTAISVLTAMFQMKLGQLVEWLSLGSLPPLGPEQTLWKLLHTGSKYIPITDEQQEDGLQGKLLHSSSIGVDIFFSLMRSYFWRLVAALRPCQGRLPRMKYIST